MGVGGKQFYIPFFIKQTKNNFKKNTRIHKIFAFPKACFIGGLSYTNTPINCVPNTP